MTTKSMKELKTKGIGQEVLYGLKKERLPNTSKRCCPAWMGVHLGQAMVVEADPGLGLARDADADAGLDVDVMALRKTMAPWELETTSEAEVTLSSIMTQAAMQKETTTTVFLNAWNMQAAGQRSLHIVLRSIVMIITVAI